MHAMPPGRLVAAGLIALFLCWSPSLAANDDGTWELGGFLSFVRFDPDLRVSSEFAPSVLVGYNFTKRHGGELSFTTVGASAERGPAIDVDADIIRAGYTFNTYRTENRVPFFRAGIGLLMLDVNGEGSNIPDSLQDPDDEVLLYGGGGIRWFINQKWAVRLAGTLDFFQGNDGWKNPQSMASADIGVVYLFGTRDVRPLTEPLDDEADTE